MLFDPTKTIMLRNLFSKAIRLRYLRLNKSTKDIYENIFGDYKTFENVKLNDIKEFRIRIGQKFGEIFGGTKGALPDWAKSFIRRAYIRGIFKTHKDLKSLLKSNPIDDYLYFGKNLLPQDKIKLPKRHRIRLESIYERNFINLQNMSKDSVAFVIRKLDEGITSGVSIEEVAQSLNKPSSLSPIYGLQPDTEYRALLIARTEIIRTHNLAYLEESHLIEEETDTEIVMRWISVLGPTTRDTHRARHNKYYSKEMVNRLIGDFNCQCTVVGVVRKPSYIISDNEINQNEYISSF